MYTSIYVGSFVLMIMFIEILFNDNYGLIAIMF